jgi:hypothetical protein
LESPETPQASDRRPRGLLASSDSNGALVAGVDDNGLQMGWQWSGGTSNATTPEQRMSIPETPEISMFRNRAYDQSDWAVAAGGSAGSGGRDQSVSVQREQSGVVSDPLAMCG